MAQNLRDRLRRIQEHKKSDNSQPAHQPSADISFFKTQGWDSCGYQTLKRKVSADAPDVQAELPRALAVIVPDLDRICKAGRPLPETEDFLFFDLETTGLSGGAGTVAFIAAFGRFVRDGTRLVLRITQYLLLDYPGENDFLEAVLGEYSNNRVVVSYNGKCFDSQILKTRCLMNGIKPPEYLHVDLLHPARRLWKSVLEDCSQGTIETHILGLDRTGDIPGALAPEIWFDFLKTGDAGRLTGICDHNRRDIAGLASILCAMSLIAADPCGAVKKYRYDLEQLALRWRDFSRQSEKDKPAGDGSCNDLQITGAGLLRLAAKNNCPKASFVYALDQLRGGNFDEGRKRLLDIAAGAYPESLQAASLRALAIDSERRLGNPAEALEFVKQGLKLQSGEMWRREFERRAHRLEKKLDLGNHN